MEGYYDSIHKDGSKCRERDGMGSIQRLRQVDQMEDGTGWRTQAKLSIDFHINEGDLTGRQNL